MSNIQMALYLIALLSIYALAATLDQQAERSNLRVMARSDVLRCTHPASPRGAALPTEASASATRPAC